MVHGDVVRIGAAQHHAGVHTAVRSASDRNVGIVVSVGHEGGQIPDSRSTDEEKRATGAERRCRLFLRHSDRPGGGMEVVKAAHLAHVVAPNVLAERFHGFV